LDLKAKLESRSPYYGPKRKVSGAFNVGLIGQPAPPYDVAAGVIKVCKGGALPDLVHHGIAAQVHFESKV
jgi:hypothetical protein